MPEGSVIETIQSLIVAFVLAMTFRGFVTEGFVIPTGSMAPTLLGRHSLIQSDQTGLEFAVGLDQFIDTKRPMSLDRLADPMLGPGYPGSAVPHVRGLDRMGDRILVLKCLYPFWEPRRFDVVVFKNPTDPAGEAANYIKRLIGLPDEQVWLADGDVFAMHNGAASFAIQRKPEYVQRAVWRPVYDSDCAPMNPSKLNRRWEGPPWTSDDASWDLSGRSFACSSAAPSSLAWSSLRRSIDDWTAYNMFSYLPPARPLLFAVSDIRVCATIVPRQAGLKTTLELLARDHLFQFTIDGSTASVRMKRADAPDGEWVERSGPITPLAPDEPANIEFWHVDQSMKLFINGNRVAELEYDWSPVQRLQYATDRPLENDLAMLLADTPKPAELRWRFEGSPVQLHRVRLDRDLFYRHDTLEPNRQQKNQPYVYGEAFGTHPTENAAILNGDQFMMCGDNSQMSLDSRLWGSPHPLVAAQIDDHPFTVHRKLLLGKAWLVYFPAPYSISDGGVGVVPDFGRLRLIR